jgi:hypothetical protein
MKITCIHGYFIVKEDEPGDVAKFNSFYTQDLVQKDWYYTFQAIADCPSESILGKPFLGSVGTATYAGKPWELFEQNGYVYDFINDLIVPIISITAKVDPIRELATFSTGGLIQPGSIVKTWTRIKGFQCQVDCDYFQYEYSELTYV